jgi:hypothetical protein
MDNFEKELTQMTKPQVSELRHQEMLANEIIKAKDKSVLNWWWLSISIFMIGALLMKTLFMPQTTLRSNLHELAKTGSFSLMIFFIILPLIVVLINIIAIRRIYFLSGSPKSLNFLKVVWINVLFIIASIIIILIYII